MLDHFDGTAVDSVAVYMIEINPDDIRLIELGKKAELGESDISKIKITG